MRDDDFYNKKCHTEGHQKVCVLPPGPKYWPKVLDSQSKVYLIIGHNTQKNFALKSLCFCHYFLLL